jgi:SAM-dependent methyltransferase
LDVGCGYGRLLDFFKLQGWETYGVEPGVCASQFAQKNGHIVVNSDLRPGTFADDFFSAAVFCHSLEHIRNPVDVLIETFRILEPGGMIVIEVPNAACADAMFYKEDWHAWHIPFHLYHWTPSSLEAAVQKAGFTIDRICTKTPKFSDIKNSITSLSRIGQKSLFDIFIHITKTLVMGHLGLKKKYYGHYIAIYGHKPYTGHCHE